MTLEIKVKAPAVLKDELVSALLLHVEIAVRGSLGVGKGVGSTAVLRDLN